MNHIDQLKADLTPLQNAIGALVEDLADSRVLSPAQFTADVGQFADAVSAVQKDIAAVTSDLPAVHAPIQTEEKSKT